MDHRAALSSVSLTLSRTPTYASASNSVAAPRLRNSLPAVLTLKTLPRHTHLCALILLDTSALYKLFTYLLTYLLT